MRFSQVSNILIMIEISYQKRRLDEKAQHQFLKYAGPDTELSQAKWFEELLAHDGPLVSWAQE